MRVSGNLGTLLRDQLSTAECLAVPPYPKVRTKKLNPKFIVPKADPRDKRETHRTIAIELDKNT